MTTPTDEISLFLCGDVMFGRGIDQIQRHPVSPELFEAWVRHVRDYRELTLRDETDSGTPLLQPVMKDGQVLDDMHLERLDHWRREVQALPDSVKRLSSLGVSAGIEVRRSDKLKAFDEAVLKKI